MMTFTAQKIGERVIYVFTDSFGATHEYTLFTSDPSFDPQASGELIGVKLEGRLAEREVAAWLEKDVAPIAPVYATLAQWRDGLRAAYKTASKQEACRLAWKLRHHFANGDLSAAMLRNLFDTDAAGLTVIQTRLDAQADAYDALTAAEGV